MGKNQKKSGPKPATRAPGPSATGASAASQGRLQDVEVETPATPSNSVPPPGPNVQPAEAPVPPAKDRTSADTTNTLYGSTTSTVFPRNSFKSKSGSSFLEIPAIPVATSASPTVYGPNSAVLTSDPSSLEAPTDRINGDATPSQRTVVPNTPVADYTDGQHGGPKVPPEVYPVPNAESPSKEKAVRFLHAGPHSVQEHSEAEDAVVTSQDVEEPITALAQRPASPTVRQDISTSNGRYERSARVTASPRTRTSFGSTPIHAERPQPPPKAAPPPTITTHPESLFLPSSFRRLQGLVAPIPLLDIPSAEAIKQLQAQARSTARSLGGSKSKSNEENQASDDEYSPLSERSQVSTDTSVTGISTPPDSDGESSPNEDWERLRVFMGITRRTRDAVEAGSSKGPSKAITAGARASSTKSVSNGTANGNGHVNGRGSSKAKEAKASVPNTKTFAATNGRSIAEEPPVVVGISQTPVNGNGSAVPKANGRGLKTKTTLSSIPATPSSTERLANGGRTPDKKSIDRDDFFAAIDASIGKGTPRPDTPVKLESPATPATPSRNADVAVNGKKLTPAQKRKQEQDRKVEREKAKAEAEAEAKRLADAAEEKAKTDAAFFEEAAATAAAATAASDVVVPSPKKDTPIEAAPFTSVKATPFTPSEPAQTSEIPEGLTFGVTSRPETPAPTGTPAPPSTPARNIDTSANEKPSTPAQKKKLEKQRKAAEAKAEAEAAEAKRLSEIAEEKARAEEVAAAAAAAAAAVVHSPQNETPAEVGTPVKPDEPTQTSETTQSPVPADAPRPATPVAAESPVPPPTPSRSVGASGKKLTTAERRKLERERRVEEEKAKAEAEAETKRLADEAAVEKAKAEAAFFDKGTASATVAAAAVPPPPPKDDARAGIRTLFAPVEQAQTAKQTRASSPPSASASTPARAPMFSSTSDDPFVVSQPASAEQPKGLFSRMWGKASAVVSPLADVALKTLDGAAVEQKSATPISAGAQLPRTDPWAKGKGASNSWGADGKKTLAGLKQKFEADEHEKAAELDARARRAAEAQAEKERLAREEAEAQAKAERDAEAEIAAFANFAPPPPSHAPEAPAWAHPFSASTNPFVSQPAVDEQRGVKDDTFALLDASPVVNGFVPAAPLGASSTGSLPEQQSYNSADYQDPFKTWDTPDGFSQTPETSAPPPPPPSHATTLDVTASAQREEAKAPKADESLDEQAADANNSATSLAPPTVGAAADQQPASETASTLINGVDASQETSGAVLGSETQSKPTEASDDAGTVLSPETPRIDTKNDFGGRKLNEAQKAKLKQAHRASSNFGGSNCGDEPTTRADLDVTANGVDASADKQQPAEDAETAEQVKTTFEIPALGVEDETKNSPAAEVPLPSENIVTDSVTPIIATIKEDGVPHIEQPESAVEDKKEATPAFSAGLAWSGWNSDAPSQTPPPPLLTPVDSVAAGQEFTETLNGASGQTINPSDVHFASTEEEPKSGEDTPSLQATETQLTKGDFGLPSAVGLGTFMGTDPLESFSSDNWGWQPAEDTGSAPSASNAAGESREMVLQSPSMAAGHIPAPPPPSISSPEISMRKHLTDAPHVDHNAESQPSEPRAEDVQPAAADEANAAEALPTPRQEDAEAGAAPSATEQLQPADAAEPTPTNPAPETQASEPQQVPEQEPEPASAAVDEGSKKLSNSQKKKLKQQQKQQQEQELAKAAETGVVPETLKTAAVIAETPKTAATPPAPATPVPVEDEKPTAGGGGGSGAKKKNGGGNKKKNGKK